MIPIPESVEDLERPTQVHDSAEDATKAQKKEQLYRDIEQHLQFKLETAPFDPRFPTQNQTKNCWQNYVDYHKCIRAKGVDYKPCDHFKWLYNIVCPPPWVERWDELVADGRFPSNTVPPKLD